MDLCLLFTLALQYFLLLRPLVLQGSLAVQSPTSRYSQSLSKKELKEDIKRRRQHARREPISFKPPPADWPEPALSIGAFVVAKPTQATSVSPLNAYQAKLEQEFLLQQEKANRDRKSHLQKTVESLGWTSSQKELEEYLTPLKKLKKQVKVKISITEVPKVKKPRKKDKKFSFATKFSKELKDEGNQKESKFKKTRKAKLDRLYKVTFDNLSVVITSPNTTKEIAKDVKSVKIETSQGTTEVNIDRAIDETRSSKETEPAKTGMETPVPNIKPLKLNSTENNLSGETLSSTVSTIKVLSSVSPLITFNTSDSRRHEIRKKRRQIKQEMKKILKLEQLEESFGDKDYDWTTSEPHQIPLDHVTPRHALLGIIKHKVMTIIDKFARGIGNLTYNKIESCKGRYLDMNTRNETASFHKRGLA